MKKFYFIMVATFFLCTSCEFNAPLLTGATEKIDSINPLVTRIFPSNRSSIGIQYTTIVVTMSEKVMENTVNKDTFIVTAGGEPVGGDISINDLSIRFNVADSHGGGYLLRNTHYEIKLTTGICDLYGNGLLEDKISNYYTTIGPSVSNITSSDGKPDISVDADIIISFNEKVIKDAAAWKINVQYNDGELQSIDYGNSSTEISWVSERLHINPVADFPENSDITVTATGFLSSYDNAAQLNDPFCETLKTIEK